MLAVAAPGVSHRGASAAVYCVPSEKANRKAQLDRAKSVTATASGSAARAAALVKKVRKTLAGLPKLQAKAKKAYFKKHHSAKARAKFVKAQHKTLAKVKASLKVDIARSTTAQRNLARARAAQAAAQASFSQCT
ncbi:MAG: hypothetical protein QOH95_1073 [Gaiellaceae bacterium]|nr:hypothetical protein [Gaiellaceae bacterium]